MVVKERIARCVLGESHLKRKKRPRLRPFVRVYLCEIKRWQAASKKPLVVGLKAFALHSKFVPSPSLYVFSLSCQEFSFIVCITSLVLISAIAEIST